MTALPPAAPSAAASQPGAAGPDLAAPDADALLARLVALGCAPVTAEHPPVFTVEEAHAIRARLAGTHPGPHCKNLFVRDKRRRFTLVVVEERVRVDLKALGALLGSAGRLSFASAEDLWARLGVEPGSVTPFALLGEADTSARLGLERVGVVLDAALWRAERVNAHPLVNTRTTGLSQAEFRRVLAAAGVTPVLVDFAPSTGPALVSAA